MHTIVLPNMQIKNSVTGRGRGRGKYWVNKGEIVTTYYN